MKRAKILALILLVAPGCFSFELEPGTFELDGGTLPNPRLGDQGRVVFGNAGCNNTSTAMAIGSTATLTLEPQGEPLPENLVVGSTEPTVISARFGTALDEIVLEAHDGGEAYIELRSAANLWDGLTFTAEQAVSARYSAPEAVLAGGTLIVEIQEVYGRGGEDCPLIGGGFINWVTSPEANLTLRQQEGRESAFRVGEALGEVTLRGSEPSAGAVLVAHSAEVIDPAEVDDLQLEIQAILPGEETLVVPIDSATELPVGALFLLQLRASSEAGYDILLTLYEADWTIESGEELVEPMDELQISAGPAFSAVEAGEVVFLVEVPLLHEVRSYSIEITP